MGIRFSCHNCSAPMNIKAELAGRRGVCPECRTRFRIPLSDAEFSTPLEPVAGAEASESGGNTPVAQAAAATESATGSSGSGVVASAEAPTQPSDADQAIAENPAKDANVPELLEDGETATWYVRPPSGGQYGPATSEVLMEWIAQDRVAKNSLLWRDGWPQWREASEALPEIAHTLPGTSGGQAAEVFNDSRGSKSVMAKATTPISGEKTSPISFNVPSDAATSREFSGDSKIGTVRRQRASRRIMMVGVLAALVVGLIVTLIIVTNTGAGE